MKLESRGALLMAAAVMALSAAVLLTFGCASHQPGSTNPKPGSGIVEYRKVATDAEKSLGRALASLATVCAHSNQCSPKVFAAFSDEFQRLEVESVKIRERSQAMQTRGDAYFETWQEHMERIKDPQLRARIESQRPAFQEHFLKIKALSQEAREEFHSFLSGLRQVRNSLEKDPASLGTQSMQQTLAGTREQGEHVQRCVAGIRQELDSMTAMLNAHNASNPNSG
jgi:hypothetical protein